MVLSPRLTLEPGVTINWLDLPTGRATTQLITNRTNLTLSPRMALAVNIQYNSTSNSVISSVRYRWEYQAGSDLFVVYSDGRDTFDRRGFPEPGQPHVRRQGDAALALLTRRARLNHP